MADEAPNLRSAHGWGTILLEPICDLPAGSRLRFGLVSQLPEWLACNRSRIPLDKRRLPPIRPSRLLQRAHLLRRAKPRKARPRKRRRLARRELVRPA